MKKNYILLLLLCLCFAGCKEKTVVESDYLPIADPYVMLYEGKYYAYGTGGTVEGEGFACFSSDDLKNWTREGQAPITLKARTTEWVTRLRTARWDRGRNTREIRFCNMPTA